MTMEGDVEGEGCCMPTMCWLDAINTLSTYQTQLWIHRNATAGLASFIAPRIRNLWNFFFFQLFFRLRFVFVCSTSQTSLIIFFEFLHFYNYKIFTSRCENNICGLVFFMCRSKEKKWENVTLYLNEYFRWFLCCGVRDKGNSITRKCQNNPNNRNK